MTHSLSSTATLTRGARITGAGFLLRLTARLPFLVVGARLYGTEDLGRFAYATMVIELAAHLSTLGFKRHLVGALGHSDNIHRTATAGLCAGLFGSSIAMIFLALFPQLLVPVDMSVPGPIRGILPLIPLIATLDLMLVALLHVHELKAQVWSRSIVEPWVLLLVSVAVAIVAGSDHPLLKSHGLLAGYALAILAAFCVALMYYLRHFKFTPPRIREVGTLIHQSMPLAASDAIDWTQRRVDVLLLGQIAGAKAVGIYYLCQQVATLVQKLRLSFEPILLPLTVKALKENNAAELKQNLAHVQRWLFTVEAFVLAIASIVGGPVLGWVSGVDMHGLTPVLTLLLLAELFAGSFGIVEVPLVYAAPRQNLAIGVAVLAAEVAFGFVLISALDAQGHGAAGAALTLCTALGLAALMRSFLVRQRLGVVPPLGYMLKITIAAASLAFLLWQVKRLLIS